MKPSEGEREREKERPIVRSMREEIGDSISTQMSRGQIFPGSGPWGLGCPWDDAGGDGLPNKNGGTERKRRTRRGTERTESDGDGVSASKATRRRETEGKREKARRIGKGQRDREREREREGEKQRDFIRIGVARGP